MLFIIVTWLMYAVLILASIVIPVIVIATKKYKKELDKLIHIEAWSECFSFYNKKQKFLSTCIIDDPLYDALSLLKQIEGHRERGEWNDVLNCVAMGLAVSPDIENESYRLAIEGAFKEHAYTYGKECMEKEKYIGAYNSFKMIGSYKNAKYLRSKAFVDGNEQFLAVHRAVLIKEDDK